MLSRRFRSYAALLAVTLTSLYCESNPTGKSSSKPAAQLEVVSGQSQSAEVGTQLPEALTVRVTDEDDQPVEGQLVNFRVVSGGGDMYAGSGITDELGIVRDRWTLGTSTSVQQRVEARAVDPKTGAALLFAVFTATARPGPAVSLGIHTQPSEQALKGHPFARQPAVILWDQYGNAVSAGEPVRATLLYSGTLLGNPNIVTDATGVAYFSGLGINNTGTFQLLFQLANGQNLDPATNPGASELSTLITVTNPAPTTMTATTPTEQNGTAGQPVSSAPGVRVTDNSGVGISGITVTFTPLNGGSVTGGTAVTDANGDARVGSWTLGPAAGVQELTASASGLGSVTFRASATSAGPVAARIIKVAGDSQVTWATRELYPPIIQVVDNSGNPVSGVTVTFTPSGPTAGSPGTVTGGTRTTDAGGRAQLGSWNAGDQAGQYRLTVSVTGVTSITFTATALNPNELRIVTAPPSTVQSGVAMSPQPKIALYRYGQPYRAGGVSISAVLTSGPSGTQVGGASATTNSDGEAQYTNLTIQGEPGTVVLDFVTTNETYTRARTGSIQVTNAELVPFTGISVSTAQSVSCALDNSGKPWCWGTSGHPGVSTSTTLPVAVNTTQSFTSIAVGNSLTCALTAAGDTYCWSSAQAVAQVTSAPSFSSLKSGASHKCGLTSSGAAYCWGDNAFGQLGDGTTVNQSTPTPVSGGHTFTSITAGAFHTCGLTTAQTVLCWGKNDFSQTGAANSTSGCRPGAAYCVNTPTQVGDPTRLYKTVGAGFANSCAVSTANETLCWGYRSSGPTRTPWTASTGRAFTSLVGGYVYMCGLDGQTAYCWLYNNNGALGAGSVTASETPVAVSGGYSFTRLAAMYERTCGVLTDGTVRCWGQANVGDNTTQNRQTPTMVVRP